MIFFDCLNCRNELARRSGTGGFLYRCNACHSYAASVPLLRRVLPPGLVNQLWSDARNASSCTGRGCPMCEKPMFARASHQGKVLEVCTSCRIVWFDPGDFPGDPAMLEGPFQQHRLSPRTREALATHEVERIRRQGEQEKRRDRLMNVVFRTAFGTILSSLR